MDIRACVIGLTVLCASVSSSSLTLGRVRGAAIVGQPLDVTVQVQLDGDEAASSLCIEADVFHSDTRQDPGRVRVTVESAQQAQTANVRIYSTAQIDEPVVTIYLKAGCGQKSTRKYVLLADYASEPALPATPAALPLVMSPSLSGLAASAGTATASVPPGTGSVQPSGSGAVQTASAPTARAATSARSEGQQANPPVARKAVKPKAPVVASAAGEEAVSAKPREKEKPARTAGQSRLKLDPLVMLAERVASLESTTAAPPPETLKDAQRLQSLEGDVKALLALAAKNEAALLEMRLKLQKAESERLPAEWVYALTALVVACLGMLVFALSRRRAVQATAGKNDWWSGSKAAPLAASGAQDAPQVSIPADLVAHAEHHDADQRLESDRQPQGRPSQVVSTTRVILDDDPASEMDVSLVEMSPSNFDNLMQSNESHSALRRGPLPRQTDAPRSSLQPAREMRSINSDALFDIRQQAEFFVSLGQTDQAVRILENRINDDGESSPLLYLDLLSIFHSLGLKTDFRQFREDFNLLFNGRVPEFESFKDEGRGLEGYPHVLAHIIALWGTPKVLMVIESSIFRDPWDDKSPPFDLAAFRDLLLLHAIAQTRSATAGPSVLAGSANAAVLPSTPARSPSPSGLSEPPADERRGPSPVDVNLSVEGSLDLDLDAHAAGSHPSASDTSPGFPKLITEDGATMKNGSSVDPTNLLDFSLPELPTEPGNKAKH